MSAKPARTSQPGIVSLLALILMATVTATSVGAAAIIINELRQTQSLDEAISAVYAAEAGVEDGLYLIKNRRPTQGLDSTIAALNGDPGTRRNLENFSSWTRVANKENQFLLGRLAADTTAHLDIFDPDAPLGGTAVQSLKVNWGVNCNSVVQLEISMLTWDLTVPDVFNPDNQQVFKETFACGQTVGGNGSCDPIVTNSIGGSSILPNKPYRFSFRVLVPENSSCLAENISVTAHDQQNGSGGLIQLPTRIQIKSTGGYSRSQQALTASVPWRAPVSGLLNFVLFSDEPVQK